MRTNIDLNDNLLEEAWRLPGLRTKNPAPAVAATVICHTQERKALAMFGNLESVGDLKASGPGCIRCGADATPPTAS